MKRLFVLGNGFDLLHNLKTRYLDFFNFSEKYYTGLLDDLIEYFDHLKVEENWYDFENALSYLNDSKISEILRVSKFGNFIEASKSVERYFEEVRKSLDFLLLNWSFNISNNELSNTKTMFIFNDNDEFVTFNYTNTLEYKYKIDREQVLHLHGSADGDIGDLIYGHNDSSFYDYIYEVTTFGKSNNDFDVEDELSKKIAEESKKLTKPTQEIIQKNYNKLTKNYGQIIFIGHSYSKVDSPYLNIIIDANPNSNIIFHCHDEKTKNKLKENLDIKNNESFKILNTIEIKEKFCY